MRLPVTILAAAAMLAAVSCGQRPHGEWIDMMPGGDVAGWTLKGASAEVSDGGLALSGEGLLTFGSQGEKQPDFRNFKFAAEVRTEPDAVSAVWFHRGGRPGYRVVINNTPWSDELRKTGSLYNVRNVYKSVVPDGRWFPLEITVRGKQVEVRVDGVTVADYVEPDSPYRMEEGMSLLGSGTFALETFGGTTHFRDVKVMPLPKDAAGSTDAVDESVDPIIRLQQQGFPVIDFHVHLKGWDRDAALANSRRAGIFYGIAPNCGIGFPITSDGDVSKFLDTTRNMSSFLAMQGEGREWPQTFSRESMNAFDYVFTDALTFTDHKGRRVRLWIDDEVIIDIPQERYMEIIVDKTVEVIMNEPIDIFVNPCFLPTAMLDRYDEFWTDARIKKVVDALVAKGVALEINARYCIPNAKTIKAAMDAGVKLAFGTNNGDPDLGKLEYCLRMMDECGIRAEHMFFPKRVAVCN